MGELYGGAQGLYAEIMERTASGKPPFKWQRVALRFYDDRGVPLVGKDKLASELSEQLGMNKVSLIDAIKRCRDHGLPIITVRHKEPCGPVSYVIPSTEQEARSAASKRLRYIMGCVATTNNIIGAQASSFEIADQRIEVMTENALQQLGGEIAVKVARELMEGESHAIQTASA